MSRSTKWLVEEKNPSSNTVSYSQTFDTYEEASSMYDYLKNKKENTVVSLNRQQKPLLLG